MNKNVHTFIGCDAEYTESKMVIFGAPYDSTTSFRPGTRFASTAIRNESFGIETYSPYQDKDLEDINVFDAGDIELPFGNTSKTLDMLGDTVRQIVDDGKFPLMIGGEHSITAGPVKVMLEKYPDLHIIQFDAHTDLRDEYLGVKESHASVIKRCWDMLGDGRIFQFGIRSGQREEFEWAKEHTHLQKFNFDGLEDVIEQLKGKPVYFTLDLDVLDPSEFPGTGTPEAGGVRFMELLRAIEKISVLNIVAADMNELCPLYDQSGQSTALACKLLREIMLYFYK
ncbi:MULTISPECIES: agmatinase [unclassified Granulicatella]|uniref:agmatinase n=1 Tax=unclassified Granulicatella TaxID=2630493 RepID=UPI001073153F|nr:MULTISPECIES: agmatinase [unclassified Granulicatella]MBF0779718.1 agmatinase [Granulicatella sp. 19428wC4_WM01]TFU96238.1 agmatinase [Granulicatella sp. WM01]